MGATASMCKARNRRGDPCGCYARPGSQFCFWHDPDLAEERRRGAAKGGRARHGRALGDVSGDAREVVIEGPADVVPLLVREVNEVLKLERSIKRARCIGYLADKIIRAFELTDLARRVAALELESYGRR